MVYQLIWAKTWDLGASPCDIIACGPMWCHKLFSSTCTMEWVRWMEDANKCKAQCVDSITTISSNNNSRTWEIMKYRRELLIMSDGISWSPESEPLNKASPGWRHPLFWNLRSKPWAMENEPGTLSIQVKTWDLVTFVRCFRRKVEENVVNKRSQKWSGVGHQF